MSVLRRSVAGLPRPITRAASIAKLEVALAPAMMELAQKGRALQAGRGMGGFGNFGFGQPPPPGPARLR